MAKETITALMVAPSIEPIDVQLYLDVQFLKRAVSIGLEEPTEEINIWSIDDRAAILYTRYAALLNGKVNRAIHDRTLMGTFFVVGVQNGKLTSLAPSSLEKYRAEFWQPRQTSPTDDLDAVLASLDVLWSNTEIL